MIFMLGSYAAAFPEYIRRGLAVSLSACKSRCVIRNRCYVPKSPKPDVFAGSAAVCASGRLLIFENGGIIVARLAA